MMTRPDEPSRPPAPGYRWRLSRRRFLQAGAVGAAAAMASAWPGVSSASPPPGGDLLQQLIDAPPFSFTYGGQASAALLPTWPSSQSSQDLGGGRTQTTVLWTDPASGLQVNWSAIQYAGYSTISWIVQFTNTGSAQTPTLDVVLAADFTMAESATGNWVIHTANGDTNVVTDFSQVDLPLAAGSFRTFNNLMGMSTQGHANSDPNAANVGGGWPYFNVDWGNDTGLIVALGWPGQWAVEISRPDSGTVHVQGGMANTDSLGPADQIAAAQLTQLWLNPGESIRTPLIVIQPWSAPNWTDAQNVWRQWLLAFLVPRVNGQVAAPMCPTQANDYFRDQIDTVNDELAWLNAYGSNQATAGTGGVQDHWWIDAGWYETPANWPDIVQGDGQWEAVGTWAPDPQRFPETPEPSGLKAVSERAHQLGMSLIVWFEPERAMPGTWLADNHPEWLLSPPAGNTDPYPGWGPGGAYHLDFGNPAALQWATDYFDQFITDHGVDLYREDCNYPFLAYWNNADPPGRRGITQIRYVTGHLAYWDALRQRHPGMLIDNSAGSGHRLDLELIQRSVSLIQSDVVFQPIANQSHTFSIRYWIPWTGSATRVTGSADDLYNARSNMGLSFHEALDVTSANAGDWATLKALATEWSALSGHFFGDYYSLTPYSPASDVWMAWQFNRTDTGAGHVQCFARPDLPASTSLTVQLRGLDPAATYHAWDVDHPQSISTFSGSDLMTGAGINVAPVPRPYAVTVMYQKA